MDPSQLSGDQRRQRLNIRNYLLVATIPETQRELNRRLDESRWFEAECVAEILLEKLEGQRFLEDKAKSLDKYIDVHLKTLDEDLHDDEGPPTEAARKALRKLLHAAADHFKTLDDPPRMPHISSLGGGDLECTSMVGDRTFFLSISPLGDAKTQLISMEDGKAETVRKSFPATADHVIGGLLWVHEGKSSA